MEIFLSRDHGLSALPPPTEAPNVFQNAVSGSPLTCRSSTWGCGRKGKGQLTPVLWINILPSAEMLWWVQARVWSGKDWHCVRIVLNAFQISSSIGVFVILLAVMKLIRLCPYLDSFICNRERRSGGKTPLVN